MFLTAPPLPCSIFLVPSHPPSHSLVPTHYCRIPLITFLLSVIYLTGSPARAAVDPVLCNNPACLSITVWFGSASRRERGERSEENTGRRLPVCCQKLSSYEENKTSLPDTYFFASRRSKFTSFKLLSFTIAWLFFRLV